jgi:hypothetical protein
MSIPLPGVLTMRLSFSRVPSAALLSHAQARKAYHPGEMLMNEQFHELHLEMRNGKLGLDFTHFDATTGSTGGSEVCKHMVLA